MQHNGFLFEQTRNSILNVNSKQARTRKREELVFAFFVSHNTYMYIFIHFNEFRANKCMRVCDWHVPRIVCDHVAMCGACRTHFQNDSMIYNIFLLAPNEYTRSDCSIYLERAQERQRESVCVQKRYAESFALNLTLLRM